MSRLAKHWTGSDSELSWMKIEQELVEVQPLLGLLCQGVGVVGPAPPEVFVFAKKAKVETNLILTCLATGFYLKDIVVRIRRNGRVLTSDDGLTSSGVLPNNDETFQKRESVEILKSDLSKFSCEVVHEATGVNVTKTWENPPEEHGPGAPIAGVVAGVVVVVALVAVAVGLILYLRRRRGANDNKGLPLAATPPDSAKQAQAQQPS
ncbi:RLA class I histocompatibility antigen, alpha chain 11/11-like [Pundamilia nyererei]|uniref:RLA class I histocompatibility antigen, alpha chain 11/11-like n=1 Tax=Pundamilia nyererei TaxID=303518 RepID=A0A9Y6MAU5_9CICH|nr:PREDICTED: RLA class I histocompatibility antigen, alpha chain 11/11-like [Pundamilia nyererei]